MGDMIENLTINGSYWAYAENYGFQYEEEYYNDIPDWYDNSDEIED